MILKIALVAAYMVGMFLCVVAAEFQHTVDKKSEPFNTPKAILKSVVWPYFAAKKILQRLKLL